MHGYYEEDPNTAKYRGQTAAEIAKEAAEELGAVYTPTVRTLGEDRKEVLRITMGYEYCPHCGERIK